MDISLNNTGSQVTSINLSYDSGNSGGRAAIFAVSGVSVATPATAPTDLDHRTH